MGTRSIILSLGAACLIALRLTAADADPFFAFDKAHTTISFLVTGLIASDLKCEFKRYDGGFVFDRQHPEKTQVSATLYASSLHTPNGERDETIQGPHFFNAMLFPQVSFLSHAAESRGTNDIDVEGDLTLLGITKPLTLHVHLLDPQKSTDPEKADTRFTATGTIKRSDFGMDYLPLLIDDTIEIKIDAAGKDASSAVDPN